MTYKKILGIFSLATVLTLSACSDDKNQEKSHDTHEQNTAQSNHAMNHSSDGEIPKGLKEATNPTFPIGSKAIIQAKHMEGMNGTEGVIVGAFDTIAYMVSYSPSTGGKPVPNHKWVIQEELEGGAESPLEPGAKATIHAEHMEGMQGAKATIDSAFETTVYMVDYTSTTGEIVKNHKWVIESELSAIED